MTACPKCHKELEVEKMKSGWFISCRTCMLFASSCKSEESALKQWRELCEDLQQEWNKKESE